MKQSGWLVQAVRLYWPTYCRNIERAPTTTCVLSPPRWRLKRPVVPHRWRGSPTLNAQSVAFSGTYGGRMIPILSRNPPNSQGYWRGIIPRQFCLLKTKYLPESRHFVNSNQILSSLFATLFSFFSLFSLFGFFYGFSFLSHSWPLFKFFVY